MFISKVHFRNNLVGVSSLCMTYAAFSYLDVINKINVGALGEFASLIAISRSDYYTKHYRIGVFTKV